MIYNIRHDRSKATEILNRIRKENQLSMGLGGGHDADLDLRKDGFVAKTVDYYGLQTTRTPTNLSRMSQFQDGDMLVTPHLPEYGKVSIHIVNGSFPDCYRYCPPSDSDGSHESHRILLKRSFGLNGEISIYNTILIPWRAKLPWLRFRVLPIPQFVEPFSTIVREIEQGSTSQFDRSNLDDFLKTLSENVGNLITEKLRSMSPAGGAVVSFESLCERLLSAAGYRIIRRNYYDKQGGDVDLICVRSRSDVSIFESGEVRLFVQVKKYAGETNEEAVQQVIKMLKEDPSADGCVMSLADGFTEGAEKLADNNGIVLLDRHDICAQLMSQLSDYSEK